MKYYRYMVEGVFITQGNSRQLLGFHTTFQLTAFSTRDGAAKLGMLLKERMSAHGVRAKDTALFQSYYWIHDAWEIAEELYGEGPRESGFTFFRIGAMESLYLAVRRTYFSARRRWSLIKLTRGPMRAEHPDR